MQISREIFGTINNQEVTKYKLKASSGMVIEALDYGCIIEYS